MSSPSLCVNAWAFIGGLKKKPEYNGKKVQLISKEPGWWVCRVDGVTLRVKEIHLVPRETRREEGDKEETHIHEKEMPKRQPKIPELGPNLKTFVINLKRRPDRRESIEALCKELKLNYEIVEACDGRALSQQTDARFEIVRPARSSSSSSASPSSSARIATGKKIADEAKLDYNADFQRAHRGPFERGHWHQFLAGLGGAQVPPCDHCAQLCQEFSLSCAARAPSQASSSSKRNVDKVKKVKKVKAKKVVASKMTRTQRAKVAAHLAKNPKAKMGKPKPAESSKGKPMGFSNLTLRRFRAHFQWNGRSSQLIKMAMHRVQSSDKTQKGHELWGAIGCNISHQIVLQRILDDPKLEYALILEDDCIKGKDTEEIRRSFNDNIRMIDELYKWQLIYLGGSICTKYRKKQQQEWRINEDVMRAQGVYLTHAYVIKREIIPEIMQNLQEGFAADAAFVSWLRKEWGGGNTDCCFLFEPQLLTQPGNDSRWKDSDIFAEGAYFREAFEEKGEQYSFSRACDLRKKIKKQTIDRKEDVNDEQTVYHMDEEGKFKADIQKVKELEDKKKKIKKQDEEERTKKEAIKNEPEERKKKESVKMKVGKEEEETLKEGNENIEKNEKKENRDKKKKKEKRTEKLQEEQDATDKTTEASKVRKSRKAKELNVEEAEPVQPRKRAKKAKLTSEDEIDEPHFVFKSSSARDPSGDELEQPLEDWESEDPWQEECEGQDRQEEHEVQDDEQSPALDEEIEQPGQPSKEDDLESQALALLQRHQEAPAFLKAIQNAGQQKMEMQKLFTKKTSKKGPIEELKEQLILIVKGARLNVGMVQDALTAAVFAAVKDGMIGRLRSTVEKLQNKVFSTGYRNKLIDCFMCALEFYFHVSTEDLQRLEAAMREDFSTECAKELQAYLGKGESAPYGIVVEASTGLLSTLLEKVKAARTQLNAAELCQDDLLQLIEGHKERSRREAESAAPLPHSTPSMPSMDRPGSRKRLRPCPSDPGRCDSARLSFAVPSPPSTDSEGDTSLDPMRKDLQSMSIKELRKKVAELNIPLHVARSFLDKDEMVEACTVL